MDDSTGPNPVTPASDVSKSHCGSRHKGRFVDEYGYEKKGQGTIKPISLDFNAFRTKIEASLFADLRKMEGGLSPRELYVKSNPNLLHSDFTNPRNWYNSDTRKKLIKTVSFSNNIINYNHNGTLQRGDYKDQNNKLPRINIQEQRRGTKSAELLEISNERIIDKSILRRGPSFDEAKFPKTPNISLSDTSFPPALKKSTSWPRSRRDRRQKKQSAFIKNKMSDDDNKLSLPPLNPELGRPFLPHLPSHQPWVSSKTLSNKSTKGKLNRTENVSQDLYLYLGEESKFQEKVDKWFNGIPTDNDRRMKYLEVNQRLGMPTPNMSLPKHHIYKGQITDVLLDRDKVIVPYIKEPIQYAPVFNELRIQRNGKVYDKFEINRDEYKLQQKSSLQLKMTIPLSDSNNRIYSTKQMILAIEEKPPVYKSQQAVDQRLDKKKSKINLSYTRPTNADRNTGMSFLLAKVGEGEDSSSEYYNEHESHIETTEVNGYVNGDLSNEIGPAFNTEVPPTLFPEAKTSVINLVLSSKRPTERKPHHIEMSLRKLAETQQEHLPKNDSSKAENQSKSVNENFNEQTVEVLDSVDANSAYILSSGENKLADCANVKVSKDNTNTSEQQEIKKNSLKDKKETAIQETQSTPLGTVENGLLNDSNAFFSPEENIAHSKLNKSVLSKYNVLEPFRDGSQPYIVLPTGSPPINKPACNEWTHPPTYKMDIKPSD